MGETKEPEVMSAKEESIFNSLLVVAGAAAAGAFIIKALQKEKNYGWQLVGWFGVTGSYFAILRGVSNILHHFATKPSASSPPSSGGGRVSP